MTDNNEIKIIAFLCWKWGYGAGDMAGTIRAQYPPSLRVILVPCTGRVDSDLIMRTFGRGADGVLVIGWYPHECDYETGNYSAFREIEYIKEILRAAGIDENRIKMEFCSAAEGQKFQRVVTEFDKEIRELGPNPIKIDTQMKK